MHLPGLGFLNAFHYLRQRASTTRGSTDELGERSGLDSSADTATRTRHTDSITDTSHITVDRRTVPHAIHVPNEVTAQNYRAKRYRNKIYIEANEPTCWYV